MKRIATIYNFGGLSLLYVILAILLPANTATRSAYNISAAKYHILLIAVELPLIISWFFAFYGYGRLHAYSQVLHDNEEHRPIHYLTIGCRLIAWGLPLTAITSLILNAIANHFPGFHAADIIIYNYLSAIISVVAFSSIYAGSQLLLKQAKLFISHTMLQVLLAGFTTLTVIFCFLAFRRLDLHNVASTHNPYYLPSWLAATSLLVPYLYSWIAGLIATAEILLLARGSSGVIYRRSLQLLAAGLMTLIIAFVALQYYRSLIPRSGHLAIGITLVIVYLFEFCIATGFGLLGLGANRLKRIEEV